MAFRMLPLLLVAGALLLSPASCVTAYDPAQPPRLGLGQRGPGMEPLPPPPRPAAISSAQPGPQIAAQPGATRPAQPLQVPTPAQPTTAIPATPAGRQLSWVIQALAGADLRRGIEPRFTQEFLAQIPPARFRAVIQQWRRDELAGGEPRIISITQGSSPDQLTALLGSSASDRHTQVRLAVDNRGRIASLLLSPALDVDTGDIPTWARLDQRLSALRGTASIAAFDITDPARALPLHTFDADRPLAIGSTFKLLILGALAEMVHAGEASWDLPLPIKDELKSLPSGQMQLELEGAEFPLSRFAELMISISDNTAADHLLAFVGRERVEAYAARHLAPDSRNTPLLSTMEMFKLKLGPDRTLAERYATADEDRQRRMLAIGGDVEATIPSFAAAALWRSPFEIERLEWFATTADLCRLMADLHRLEQLPGMEPLRRALRMNPGLAFDRQTWPGVAYKGGSEPGVLNMTWLLERRDGRFIALSITWNDSDRPVELPRMAELAGAAVRLLAAP